MSAVRTYGKKGTKRNLDSGPVQSSSKKPKIDSIVPSTPKAAQDYLSHIFDTDLPSPAPSTPNRLSKRMLGRSKTEPTLGDSKDSLESSSKSLLDKTSSLPSFTSPPKRSIPPPSEPSSSPQRPAMNHKRTYAGKSRSFLVAMPADRSLPEELQDDYNNRESYAVLRSRWGVDNSEDDPYPEPLSPLKSNTTTPSGSPSKGKGKGRLKQEVNVPADIIQPLRSITEIRNKGESRRFLDEVGYLLEGMGKDETPALKKASALEIISRLCEPDFVRQAKAADFLQSTWDAFIEAGGGTGEDKVLDTLIVAFAALVSRDLLSLTDLAQRVSPSSSTSSHPSFTTILFSLVASLTPETDPLLIISQSSTPDGQLKRLGIMKTDRAILKTLHSVITSQARIFHSKTPISDALLITHTLATVPVELLSCAHMSLLLQSLRAQLQAAIDGLSSITSLANVDSASGITKPSSSSKSTHTTSYTSTLASLHLIPFSVIHTLLALLDGYLLAQWAPSREVDHANCRRLLDEARDEWLADGLVAVGITAELSTTLALPMKRKDKHRTGMDASSRCTEIIFRVLVSLTHSDPLWGQTLTKNSQAMMFIVRTIVRADDFWGTIMAGARRSSISLLTGRTAINGKHNSKNTEKPTTRTKVEKVEEDGKTTDYDSEDYGNGNFDQPTTVTERSSPTRALDWLCLSLGLITNLVQVVDEAKIILRETMLDPDCIQKTIPCIRVCSCRRPTSVLKLLVSTYEHQLPFISVHSTRPVVKIPEIPLTLETEQQEQQAEADASFLLGHLSVLFGLLMMDSSENQEIVLDSLPLLHLGHEDIKPNSNSKHKLKQQKLGQLVENASELGVFYTVISRRGLSGNGIAADTPDPGQSHEENDAARGADVAKGVISFLRYLLDSL
ncbi:uncharacterized protein C8R40DRAFT_1070500 [Lentinula edodes]|uniref:uncharacterized protein n=1 Tax=Lentinula edodes TaxID=5353 RepID=UPI001BF4CE07|nr:uncharacterized protein C8R40DRAFT_1070500 [Lentinula edodes]KAF8825515.1 hypothetical protein HHX47_DHR6000088 [Lentinula edodes]KAH7874001.1 hypothetical protein C8R40DRAFT_1070500 [Lentinula edodes]